MPKLRLQRGGSTLEVILGERQSSFPLADVALSATTWEHIYDDAAAYGRELFDKTFGDEQLRTMLANLPSHGRLVLVAEDPLVAAIPWEYLRDQNNKLLASRLNFVRSVPEAQRRDDPVFPGPLEIVAIPVSPVDEPRVLDVEREWKNLVEAITVASPPKSLTLKRVRPPTRSQLERSLSRQCTSIVHFMGHSTGYNGKAFLTLEDARACSHLVDAIDLIDSLHSRISLVVLISCLSHNIAHTEFGNIAHSLVLRGVPYALVTQFSLPDDAALVLSTALYTSLLQGASIEEVVTSTRRSLEKPGKQSNAAWLAGIPVLYTGLRRPAPALELAAGKPVIQPDPEQLQKTTDFTALPRAEHFVGRSREIRQVLNALLSPHARSFVLLHGLGGTGKTATAQVVAERVGWHYQDRVLAISFETFASTDSGGQLRINEQFVDRFYNRLARFYAIDPAQYSSPIDLQQPILQQRAHLRSLLILDNIETLIDAQKRQHPTAKALASFIGRLKEGDGAILLTSRIIPPSDWGDCQVVYLSNLSEKDGADLFLAHVPTERKHLAPLAERFALSQRVQGHPLSIQLLAGRFADDATGLTAFLEQIETELEMAELQTPSSLEDPERQRTLYACMDYSVKRLTLAQRKVLDVASLFLTPFLPEFAAYILEDKEQTLIHLQHLVRLGLLTATIKTFPEGELILLELHPMLRWYLQLHFPAQDAMLRKRYGELFHWLAYQSYEYELGYDQSPMMLFLVRQSLPDFEAAFQYLPFIDRGTLAYYLAEPYKRLGQNQHALALYEQALEIVQKSEKKQMEAVIKESMAHILLKLGQPPKAMALYEQALSVKQELGDVRGTAVTQALMADALAQLGRPLEAMKLYEQALQVKLELGERKGAMAIQTAMANLLRDLGKLRQAANFYEQALQTARELGVARGVAVILHGIANLLAHDEPQEALTLYEQSLKEAQESGDVPGVVVTQNALADVLVKLGKLQEALELYEQALQTKRELGDVRGVSMTQADMANVLRKMDKTKEALILYEQALHTAQELGDVRGVGVLRANFSEFLFEQGAYHRALMMIWEAYTGLLQIGYIRDAQLIQQFLISLKEKSFSPVQFDTLWEQVISDPQPQWLCEEQVNSLSRQKRLSTEELKDLVANTISVLTLTPERRDEWRETVSGRLYSAQSNKQEEEAEFFAAMLAVLDNQTPSLPEKHSYADAIYLIQSSILARKQGEGMSVNVTDEIMQIMREFMDTKGWEATRYFIEARQAVLFRPEFETLFEQNIAQAQAAGDLSVVRVLGFRLSLLRACKSLGIETALGQIKAAQQESSLFDIDTELIPRSIAALSGDPLERMEHMRYLTKIASQTANKEMRILIEVVQLALFGCPLEQLGQDLEGRYRQVWESIVTGAKAQGDNSL